MWGRNVYRWLGGWNVYQWRMWGQNVYHLAYHRQVLLSKTALVLLLTSSKQTSGTPTMPGGRNSGARNSTRTHTHTHTHPLPAGSESRALNNGISCNTTWQECCWWPEDVHCGLFVQFRCADLFNSNNCNYCYYVMSPWQHIVTIIFLCDRQIDVITE